MGIKITRGDYTIEVDTENELRMVLGVLGTPKQTVSLRPSDAVAETSTLVFFYQSIARNSKLNKALRLLKDRPEGLSTTELVRELGLEGGVQALGGILGYIGKLTGEIGGMETNDVYSIEPSGNGSTIYKLTKRMSEAIDEADKVDKEQ